MTTRVPGLAAAAAAALVLEIVPARAQDVELEDFPMPTDRNFAIDIYQGAVLGSVEIVGMGGVAVATARGAAGIASNPASPAVRPETSTSRFDWDIYVDWLNPDLGTDFDNNGIESEQEVQALPVLTGGLVLNHEQWAIGGSFVSFSNVVPIAGTEDDAVTTIGTARFVLARALWEDRLTLGIGVLVGAFEIAKDNDRLNQRASLFSISGASLEAGAIWRPHWYDIRVGVSGTLPVSGTDVANEECDPLDCEGYILPERAEVPWRVAAGVAWYYGETRWNRPVYKRWRDERYVLLAGDVIVIGPTDDGYGPEAFSQMRLQPAGRNVSIGVRTGVEYEWVPGRFRIRGGVYYEPSRYQDGMGDDIAGRPHLTLGLDVRVWSFRVWSKDYRLRLSLTSDGAEGYANGGVSIGFWH